VRFLNAIVWFDLIFAGLGIWAAWYTGQAWAYPVCISIAVGGIALKVIAKAYDSVKRDWTRRKH